MFFWSKGHFKSFQHFSPFLTEICMGANILYSHYTSLKFTESTVTTLQQGGLCSMGCLDILSNVAGSVSLPLSKAGHLVQQCLCLLMIISLFSIFSFFHLGMKTLIYQTQAAGVVGRHLCFSQ